MLEEEILKKYEFIDKDPIKTGTFGQIYKIS